MNKWIWEEKHNEARDRLIKACKAALVRKDFQRHAYGKNKTHCNRAAAWIAEQCGYDTTWMHYNYINWKAEKGKLGLGCVMTANSITRQANKEAKSRNIIRITSTATAHFTAWLGIPVLLCALSTQKGRSGHVAIVYPTPEIGFLQVCNIGWNNLICSPGDQKSFGGGKDYLSAWSFYKLGK